MLGKTLVCRMLWLNNENDNNDNFSLNRVQPTYYIDFEEEKLIFLRFFLKLLNNLS